VAARWLPRGQAGSADWAPAGLCAEYGVDRCPIVVVVRACLAGKVDSDRVDDELCPFDGRSSVALGDGCAVGDDVPVVELALLVVDGAVVVGAGGCPDEVAAGPQIELDAPLVVALAEVEAVAVDFPAPLFGRKAAMTGSMTGIDISELDLSYTPPLGSPWDATQVATQAWVCEHQLLTHYRALSV
jgi:hypothetical protein